MPTTNESNAEAETDERKAFERMAYRMAGGFIPFPETSAAPRVVQWGDHNLEYRDTSLREKQFPFALAHQELHDLKDGDRHNYLGPPHSEKLDHACQFINRALGETCYLVGSATWTKAYRDVDIRVMMEDEKYEMLFGTSAKNEFWSLLCTGVSEWLSKVANLPVDFQIQKRTRANKQYPTADKHRRNAMGIYTNAKHNPELMPAWRIKDD